MKTIHLVPSEKNKNIIKIPDSIGMGTFETIVVKPGLYLVIEDFSLDEEVRFTYSPGPENYKIAGVGFCLSGYGMSQPNCFKEPFRIASGHSIYFSFPSGTQFYDTIKSKRMLDISLMILPEFINACLKDFPELLSDNIRLFFDEMYQRSHTISGAVQNLLNQILSCPFKGIGRQFFIEGKVMEILAHLLNQNQDRYPLHTKDAVQPQEVEKVQKAADIMRLSHDKFKNLESIAKSVGMCRSRFHKCFSLVYGMSPFEYLRNFRMETAKSFMASGDMSITEIAYGVGYSSLSHFAKIFKKYEGVSPSEFKNKDRR